MLRDDDLLLITADHGNDPTWVGTDHTRELVPVLGYNPTWTEPIELGDRHSFGDVGKTIAHNFGITSEHIGESFLDALR